MRARASATSRAEFSRIRNPPVGWQFARAMIWIRVGQAWRWRVGPHTGKPGGEQIFRGPTERLPRLPPNLGKQALADRGDGRCRQALIAAP